MNKKKISTIKIFRTGVQLLFFVLLPELYVNAFLGIRIVYQGLLNHNFNFTSSFPHLISAISVIPLTILFGRFFCGWMCAFGTLGDFMFYIGRKVFKIKFKISEEMDQTLKYVKYVLLLFLVLIVWSIRDINISSFSPWDAFGSLLTFTGTPDFSYVIKEVTVGFIFFVMIMISSMFVDRFFCRYLCPLGAVFAIVSKLRFIRIKKPSAGCGKCRACTKNCPMGIPLYSVNRVDSGECIDCMNCVTICPRDNVSVDLVTVPANPAVVGAFAVTAMSGIYYISTFATEASASGIGTNLTVQTATENNSPYADGTYEGSGTGFRGATTIVSVTVKSGQISNIETLSYGDDAPYYNSAYQFVVSQIIQDQTTEVDAVSGATFSSNGIMEAVASALDLSKEAKTSGTTSSQVTDRAASGSDVASNDANNSSASSSEVNDGNNDSNKTTDSNLTNNTATSSKATPTKAPVKNNVTQKNSVDQSSETASNSNSNASTGGSSDSTTSSSDSTNTASATTKYKDGTYEGSAQGFRRGITTVSVTVKNDVITDIAIVSNGDDAPFFNSASGTIINEILDSQNAMVDAVSGATYSSNGIMNAVADALSSALNN